MDGTVRNAAPLSNTGSSSAYVLAHYEYRIKVLNDYSISERIEGVCNSLGPLIDIYALGVSGTTPDLEISWEAELKLVDLDGVVLTDNGIAPDVATWNRLTSRNFLITVFGQTGLIAIAATVGPMHLVPE